MSTRAQRQKLRVLEGRYVVVLDPIEAATDADGDWLVHVFGPDGHTGVRRDDEAIDGWVALWSGEEPHALDATGMLSALVAPLADGQVPVMVASTFRADLVLVPADRTDDALRLLRGAGHEVLC